MLTVRLRHLWSHLRGVKECILLRDLTQRVSMRQVLHGGDNDVLWLQRDFHLYIVNAFDTEKACQVKACFF